MQNKQQNLPEERIQHWTQIVGSQDSPYLQFLLSEK
jgi:hypothetical protein